MEEIFNKTKKSTNKNYNLLLQEKNCKWLRKRLKNSNFYDSVSSLVKSKEEKKISNTDNKNEIKFNPKYLFNDFTLQKIIKLKNIFLEFDDDGSKKLELNELETMFKVNNIDVTLEELKSLFFPNRKFLKGEEPFLDFFQLYQFVMDNKNDYRFKLFMRNIKKKIRSSALNNNLNYENENSDMKNTRNKNYNLPVIKKETATNSLSFNTKKDLINKEEVFLPMNFELLLEFLNSKGKIRMNENKINEMNDLMSKFNEMKFFNKNDSGNTFNESINIDEIINFPHEKIDIDKATKYYKQIISLSKIENNNESLQAKPNLKESIVLDTLTTKENENFKIKKLRNKLSFKEKVNLDLVLNKDSKNTQKVLKIFEPLNADNKNKISNKDFSHLLSKAKFCVNQENMTKFPKRYNSMLNINFFNENV